MNIFIDREQAGRFLAEVLRDLRSREQTLVLAIPRGGVVVGKVVAQELHLPLDVIITRKIGAPGGPELAIGATTSAGGTLWNEDLIRELRVDQELRRRGERSQIEEAKRRETLFRKNRPPLDLAGKTVIIVDDGVATGLTMEAAIQAARNNKAARVILAIPVAPLDVAARLANKADRLEILATPEPFYAISRFFQDFEQVTDTEVEELLET